MNVPMLWITLDLVELYYSGLPLRHKLIQRRLMPSFLLTIINHIYLNIVQ